MALCHDRGAVGGCLSSCESRALWVLRHAGAGSPQPAAPCVLAGSHPGGRSVMLRGHADVIGRPPEQAQGIGGFSEPCRRWLTTACS